MRIGIIGGGAAGMFAAINLKNKNNEVIVFDGNENVLKKLLATGNGRCNYWNDFQDYSCYSSDTLRNYSLVINDRIDNKVLNVFKTLGIVPKIKNGYWYPSTNKAATIRDAIVNKAIELGVIFNTSFRVDEIINIDNKFTIKSSNESISVDKIILATGGYASPKTGSDGFGYEYLKQLGVNIIKPLPGLVQLISNEKCFKNLSGIRCDADLKVFVDDKLVTTESGELQLTDYGISGVCVFNISNLIVRALDNNKKVRVGIDFFPNVDDFATFLSYQTSITNYPIFDLLSYIIDSKIVSEMKKRLNIENEIYTNLTIKEQNEIINIVKNFQISIDSFKGYDNAQVTTGGVDFNELNDDLSLKSNNNIFVIGELLDLTGICGGYNLGICWRSAYIVSEALND